MRADHGAGAGEVALDRSIPSQRLEIGQVDLPVVDRVAAFPQSGGHEVLGRAFLETQGGDSNEIGQKRGLRREIRVNRGADRGAGCIIERRHGH